jgi:hypothetical protein
VIAVDISPPMVATLAVAGRALGLRLFDLVFDFDPADAGGSTGACREPRRGCGSSDHT